MTNEPYMKSLGVSHSSPYQECNQIRNTPTCNPWALIKLISLLYTILRSAKTTELLVRGIARKKNFKTAGSFEAR